MLATRIVVVSGLMLLLTAARLQAQDELSSARELYAAAEYDEALKVLDRLSTGESATEQRQSIALYRTLCLIAVGRRDEADRTIGEIITRDPLYKPGDELSPRTRSAFSEAKKRLLPSIVQQQYADAKSAFDRKEYETAANAFKRVIEALNDPDMGAAAGQPPLADLRTLAAGFRDLSIQSIPPPPPPAPAPAPPPPVNVLRIYTPDEPGIRLPVAIAQEVPRYPGLVPAGGLTGIVEVVINEVGAVESAQMITPTKAAIDSGARVIPAGSYDKSVLTAASKWQFQPAVLNGTPVKFRKRIQINIAPVSQ